MAGKEDVTPLLTRYIRKSISDEWFAQYQYWIGAVIIDDENEDVVREFVQHEGEEWDHATDLASWLKLIPRLSDVYRVPCSLEDVQRMWYCGYIYPTNSTRESLLDDSIKGEKCAIGFYEVVLEAISNKYYYGPDIGDLLESILAKEKEHLRDLEKL